VVQLPEDDPETIERMISYLYLENYSEGGHVIPMSIDADTSPPTVGLNNADVYIAADKFDIQPLKALAATRVAHWAKKKSIFSSPVFVNMARRLLQLKHDPWPKRFVAECIIDNLPFFSHDNKQILEMMGEFGHVGLAVLAFILDRKMLQDPGLEMELCRAKQRL
jgi:hypothetical protein